jgi:diketogulonate reductase-like aldo/keto reductase
VVGPPSEREWQVIEAVNGLARALDVSPAQVALAWVREQAAITSTLVGARTLDQLRSSLASLEVTRTPEQRGILDDVSAPALNFPAAINAGQGAQLGFGGSTVDGVERPIWPSLLSSSKRY